MSVFRALPFHRVACLVRNSDRIEIEIIPFGLGKEEYRLPTIGQPICYAGRHCVRLVPNGYIPDPPTVFLQCKCDTKGHEAKLFIPLPTFCRWFSADRAASIQITIANIEPR